MLDFKFPRADQTTVVIGQRGSGKTVFGAWLLSHQRFDKRPWIILDYKREILWEHHAMGHLLQTLPLGKLPKKRDKGLYIVSIRPGQEEEVEDWLWKIWERGNIGLFADEVTLLPHKDAFKAILRQGRSKHIPLISCTQRPIDIEREVFTEAAFVSLFNLSDSRDYKTVEYFTGMKDLQKHPLQRRWSRWYDAEEKQHLVLKPCPAPDHIVDRLRQEVPYRVGLFG